MVQALDIEKNCFGLYFQGNFYFDNLEGILDKSSVAWKHSSVFDDEKYTYLSVFIKSGNLAEYSNSPESLRACQDLMESQKRLH